MLKILIIFLLLPFTIWNWFFNKDDTIMISHYKLLISYSTAPILCSWFFSQLIRAFPFQQSSFYNFIITFLAFLLVSFNYKKILLFKQSSITLSKNFKANDNVDKVFKASLIILISFLVIMILFVPLLGNDALEYFHLAELIVEKKSLAFYPITNGENFKGFIAPWTHPIGYPSWLAFIMLGLDDTLGLTSAKILTLWFTTLTCINIIIICHYEKYKYKYVSALIFLSIPLCFFNSYQSHIDSLRMLMFLVSAITTYVYLKIPIPKNAVVLGIVLGLSWFTHTTGLLTVLIMLFLILLNRFTKIKGYIKELILIIFVTLSIILPDIISIFFKHGKIIGDLNNIGIFNILSSEYKDFLSLSRNLEGYKKFSFGLGRIFYDIKLFGITLWLFTFGVLVYLKDNYYFSKNNFMSLIREPSKDFVGFSIIIFCIFFGGVLSTLLINSLVFVVNPRYLLQPMPIIALVAGLSTTNLFKQQKNFLK